MDDGVPCSGLLDPQGFALRRASFFRKLHFVDGYYPGHCFKNSESLSRFVLDDPNDSQHRAGFSSSNGSKGTEVPATIIGTTLLADYSMRCLRFFEPMQKKCVYNFYDAKDRLPGIESDGSRDIYRPAWFQAREDMEIAHLARLYSASLMETEPGIASDFSDYVNHMRSRIFKYQDMAMSSVPKIELKPGIGSDVANYADQNWVKMLVFNNQGRDMYSVPKVEMRPFVRNYAEHNPFSISYDSLNDMKALGSFRLERGGSIIEKPFFHLFSVSYDSLNYRNVMGIFCDEKDEWIIEKPFDWIGFIDWAMKPVGGFGGRMYMLILMATIGVVMMNSACVLEGIGA